MSLAVFVLTSPAILPIWTIFSMMIICGCAGYLMRGVMSDWEHGPAVVTEFFPLPTPVYNALDAIVMIVATYADQSDAHRHVRSAGMVVSDGVILTCAFPYQPLPGEHLVGYEICFTASSDEPNFYQANVMTATEQRREGSLLYLNADTTGKTPLELSSLPSGWSGDLWWSGVGEHSVGIACTHSHIRQVRINAVECERLIAEIESGDVLGGPVLDAGGAVVGLITGGAINAEMSLATPLQPMPPAPATGVAADELPN